MCETEFSIQFHDRNKSHRSINSKKEELVNLLLSKASHKLLHKAVVDEAKPKFKWSRPTIFKLWATVKTQLREIVDSINLRSNKSESLLSNNI